MRVAEQLVPDKHRGDPIQGLQGRGRVETGWGGGAQPQHLDAADGSTLSRIHVVPASEVIGMGDNPAASIRTKKNSSMRIAMEMVRSKEAVEYISAV